LDTEVAEVIECPACGTRQTMNVVKSANVARMPDVKRQLLEHEFMRLPCRSCECVLEIERDLLWVDFDQKLMVVCFDPADSGDIAACEADAIEVFRHAAWEHCPPVVRQLGTEISLRVVFGYDELREKVLCWEHGLDDKILEYLKLSMLVAHPEWQGGGFAGLRLVEVRSETLVFMRLVGGPKPLFEVSSEMMARIAAAPEAFIQWAPQVWSGPYVSATTVILVGDAFQGRVGLP